MKVDNYSNRKDRRLAQKQHKQKIVGLNKPYVVPRVIVHRSMTPTTKAVILKREDKPHKQVIIGIEKTMKKKTTKQNKIKELKDQVEEYRKESVAVNNRYYDYTYKVEAVIKAISEITRRGYDSNRVSLENLPAVYMDMRLQLANYEKMEGTIRAEAEENAKLWHMLRSLTEDPTLSLIVATNMKMRVDGKDFGNGTPFRAPNF